MSHKLSVLLESYREEVAQVLGKGFTKMILYGSYARGDFKQDSDMDIMILVDVKPEEISVYADKVYDINYDFEMQYGMEINPSVQSIQIYEQWKVVYPFFMNIEKDGVSVGHRNFMEKIWPDTSWKERGKNLIPQNFLSIMRG